MQLIRANQLAMMRFHGFGGGRGGFEVVLLLAGIAFAVLLVWVIERSRSPRIYR